MATRHLVALTVAAVSVTAQGVTIIDFDALAVGDVVTNQFPEATFSSIVGQENVVRADFNFGPLSFPNYICTKNVGGPLNCKKPTIVDFTLPVNDLTFLAMGDDFVGVQATVDVFENAVFSATVDITVDGIFNTVDVVDLSGFTNVTRIEIGNITDGSGLAWDRFTFNVVPLDSDNDGIPDDEDACPDSDLSETVIIDGCDSGVGNLLFEDGCTMADLIAECAEGAVTHGQFVSCVALLTIEWKRAGLIEDQEEGLVERCAARSNIPGDLDGDGAVGVADLVMLLGEWGSCPAHPDACPADIDRDGGVGIADLLILLANWG